MSVSEFRSSVRRGVRQLGLIGALCVVLACLNSPYAAETSASAEVVTVDPAVRLDAGEDIAECWVSAAVLSRFDLTTSGMAETDYLYADCLQRRLENHLIALFEGREKETFADGKMAMTPQGTREALSRWLGLYRALQWMIINRRAHCRTPGQRMVTCGSMWLGADAIAEGSLIEKMLAEVVQRRRVNGH